MNEDIWRAIMLLEQSLDALRHGLGAYAEPAAREMAECAAKIQLLHKARNRGL